MTEPTDTEGHNHPFGMSAATMIALLGLLISIASSAIGFGMIRGELTEAVNVNSRQDRDVAELKARVETTSASNSASITALVSGQSRVEAKVDMLLSERGLQPPRERHGDNL